VKKNKIVLVGGGGHCKVLIDAIQKQGLFEIAGITDKNNAGGKVLGIEVIGSDEMLKQMPGSGCKNAFVAVALGNVTLRRDLYKLLKSLGFELPVIVHPSAVVAQEVKIGEGTFIAAGVVVGPGTTIGANVILNTGARLDHDCAVGDFVHIAPGAVLSGGVCVGDGAHVGAGAVVIGYKKIGSNTVIGAGSVVLEDIPEGVTAYGVPCKIKI